MASRKPDINLDDEFKVENKLDSDLLKRVVGNSGEKRFAKMLARETVTTPVENSEMYRGQKDTYEFLEATAGALTTVANRAFADDQYRSFQFRVEGYNVNSCIDNIIGAEDGTKYHVNFDELYKNRNIEFETYIDKNITLSVDDAKAILGGREICDEIAGIKDVKVRSEGKEDELLTNVLKKYVRDAENPISCGTSPASVSLNIYRRDCFTMSGDNFIKAVKGQKIMLPIGTGKKEIEVDAKKFVLRNRRREETTLQSMAIKMARTGGRENLLRSELKKMSQVLEQAGIHNADRMSIAQLKKVINEQKNVHVQVLAQSILETRQQLNTTKETGRSRMRTKRARCRFARRMFADSEMVSGAYMSVMAGRMAVKLAKGVIRGSHKVSTLALKAGVAQLEMTGGALNVAAKFSGIDKLSGYQKIYNTVAHFGNGATHIVDNYANIEERNRENKKKKECAKEERKVARKINRSHKREQRRIKAFRRRQRTAVGRRVNALVIRKRKVMKNVAGIAGKAKLTALAPFKFLSAAKELVIKIVLIAAAAFLGFYLFIAVMGMLITIVTNFMYSISAFQEKRNGLSVGQIAVNNLRAQGGELIAQVGNIQVIEDQITAISKFHSSGGEYYVPNVRDDDISYVYEDNYGNMISATDFYNIKEIMTIAEIHFDGNWDDDTYYEYVKELWKISHTYRIEYGDVYYCTDEERCTNWKDYQHTDEEVNCGECSSTGMQYGVDDKGYSWERKYCNGHSGCVGHVKIKIYLNATTGDSLINLASEQMADKLKFTMFGWNDSADTDQIDYHGGYFQDRYETLMDLDWKEEYDVALSAGKFDYSAISINGETSKAVIQFLMDCGYSKAGACGIYGNLIAESHLNPTALNSAGYFGIAQWGGGRKDALFNFCAADGFDPYSLEGQLNYLYYEMSSSYPAVHSKMMIETDPVEAACYFAANFEVCFISPGGDYYGNADYYYFRSLKYQYWQGLPVRKSHAQMIFDSIS